MKKLLLLLFIGIFFISLISAVNECGNENSYLGTFKQGNDITLKQTCTSCSFVNLSSISYPNSSVQNLNVDMTQDGIEYNYTLTETDSLGCYSYVALGDPSGTNTAEIIEFKITPSGSLFTNALSIPLFLPLFLMLLLSLFAFIMMGFIEKREYKVTFLILSGVFLIFALSFGIIASREVLYGYPLLYGFVNSFYTIFIILLRVSAILIPVMAAFFVIKRVFSKRGYEVEGK